MRVLNFFKNKKEDVLDFFGVAQMPNIFKNKAVNVYLQTVEVQRMEPIPYEYMR